MAKKNALGKGLAALIKQSETVVDTSSGLTSNIEIDKIVANSSQPRTNFDQDALEELAASIKQLGIIQPITVREADDGYYQIISGERRYRASLLAGLTEIPAFIREVKDDNLLVMALVENLQREDLDAIDIAITFQRLIEEAQLTHESLSERIGKKRSTVTNYLRLLKLSPEVQLAIKRKQISVGHAKSLVNIEQTEQQIAMLNRIIENELSVRQTEIAVRNINNPEPEADSDENTMPITETEIVAEAEIEADVEEEPYIESEFESISDIPDELTDTLKESDVANENKPFRKNISKEQIINNEEQQLKELLSKRFGTRVDVKRTASGAGSLIIAFRTKAELQYILDLTENISNLVDQ